MDKDNFSHNNIKINVLHILNSYGGTEVYAQLIKSLDELGIRQIVFVPLNPNNKDRVGNYKIKFKVEGSEIIYSTKLKQYHRYFFNKKISAIKEELIKQVDINKIDLVHAGLFCTDGAVAFELSKIYKIPYLVTVRNTDVNVYYKRMLWKRRYFNSILSNSKKIIFISPGYKKSFIEILNKKVSGIEEKCEVIPNGINTYYLQDSNNEIPKINSPTRIVYAGAINRGKNILKTIKALEILIKKGYLIDFKIIGKGLKFRKVDKSYQDEILKYIHDKNWVDLLDSMPKEKLRDYLDQSDIFAMPSSPETFGIIYLEALSRNLPIIYAKGQGFDGYFKDGYVGFSVNPDNSTEIANSIENIINNYDQFISNIQELNIEKDFSWDSIAHKYLKIYEKII